MFSLLSTRSSSTTLISNSLRKSLSVMCIAALFVAVTAQAETINLTQSNGSISVPVNPQRVVVFDLATLDTLRTLGVETIAGVPDARFPAHLSVFNEARYTRAGSLFEPDYDVVKKIAPDLIIVGGRSGSKQEDLAKIATTINVSGGHGNLIENVETNTRTLASIFGKQSEAEKQLNQVHHAIAALKKKAAGAGTALVVLSTGQHVNAQGPGARFGQIHDVFGFTPVSTELTITGHGHPASMEFIAKLNPDWLFILDRDAATGGEGQPAKALFDNDFIRKTTASKKGHIIYLNAANWYLLGSAGLTSLQQNIEQLSSAIDVK